MVDDETVKVQIGEMFAECSEDYANELIEKQQEQYQDKIDVLEAEVETMATRQEELKKLLYSRFGNSINLEES
jgi:prefoldin subunit 4